MTVRDLAKRGEPIGPEGAVSRVRALFTCCAFGVH